MPFLIHGTASDPQFMPDVGGLAAGMLKSQLGCAGSVASGAAKAPGKAPSPTDALSNLRSLLKKKNP